MAPARRLNPTGRRYLHGVRDVPARHSTKCKLSPLRLARELRTFYLSLYPLLRQAAPSSVLRSRVRSAAVWPDGRPNDI